MKLKRVRNLVSLQCRGLFGKGWWAAVAAAVVAVCLLALGVGWNGERPTLFGTPEINVAPSDDRPGSIALQVASYMSTAWLLAAVGYALPVVLVPLASSFTLTQVCWLRGLNCTPREVALARACRLLAATAASSLVGALAVAVLAIRHDLSPAKLLAVTHGWAAHLLFSGGVVLALGPYLSGTAQRVTATFVALLLPVVCWLGTFLGAARLDGVSWASWLPYACPYTENFDHVVRHNAAAALIGLVLIVGSVVWTGGRVVDGFSNSQSQPEGV